MSATKLLFPMVLLVAMGTAVAATESDQTTDFEALDQNGDGMVTRDEAAAAPGLEESFDQLDANADGVLSEDEIGVGGPSMDEEPESEY